MIWKKRLPHLERGLSISGPELRETINDLIDRDIHSYVSGPGISIEGNVISAWDEGGDAVVSDSWPALIQSSQQNGNLNQWFYEVREAYLETGGYGGWSLLDGGRAGRAYNTEEEGNTASGLQKSGVDTANLVGSYAHQPIPNNALVIITERHTASDVLNYWFSRANGIDGGCT